MSRSTLIALVLLPLAMPVALAQRGSKVHRQVEGYGAVTRGAESSPAGFDVVRVTSLASSGEGTLHAALDPAKRKTKDGAYRGLRIVFAVGGTIKSSHTLRINRPYVTIDGATAPKPGITIAKQGDGSKGGLVISTSGKRGAGTHDVVVRYLRIVGVWAGASEKHSQNAGTIAIDGEDHPDGVTRVVLDHLTIKNGQDAAGDIWGRVTDVTVQWSIFVDCLHPMTISHHEKQRRERLSIHHNVFARNHERNPQIRGDVRDVDLVNNIVYEWKRFPGGYGIQIRDRHDLWPTNINVRNNLFHASQAQEAALRYSKTPYPGKVFIHGNALPKRCEIESTSPRPIAIPRRARVTAWPVGRLRREMLPHVGTRYPLADEKKLLTELGALFR